MSRQTRSEPRWLFLLTNPFLWLFLMVAVFVGGAAGVYFSGMKTGGDVQRKIAPQAGFSAPDLTLVALDGKYQSLSDLRGKVVLLNHWASWCAPCRAEMAALNNVYARYRESGLVVLGVNATSQDDEAAARAFVKQEGLTFPIVFDRDGSTGRTYRIHSLPTSYFIGRDGVIREVIIGGPMSEASVEVKIKPLLLGGR